MTDSITIVVNGEERRLARELSLSDLLAHLELDPRAVVVELNKQIVRRPALDETTVRDGDTIELVHFVGGG
jgi:thiamine biosynthesis protein ThiS